MAIKDADQTITLEPWAGIGYNHKGLALLYLGRFRQSRALLDQAIELNPNLADAFNNRGLLSFKTNSFDRAIVDLDEAIRLDPRFALAYANRAKTYTLVAQDELAQWDFARAVEFGLDPGPLELEIQILKQNR